MPERTGFASGAPSWVDLATGDVEAAKRFYGELFGWVSEPAGDDYAMFLSKGRRVAGLAPLQFENQPTWWSTYFASDDLDALTARVRDGGGTPHIEPMDVGDAGRLAFFVHPAAGAFGAWQAGTNTGAELIREPYSFSWSQLMARDVAAARAFLAPALGVETAEEDFGDEEPYVVLLAGGEPVAGIGRMPDEMPAEVPPFWDVAFEVADVDATLEKAEQLGATVTMPAMDMPGVGRFGGVRDPQGATFTVMVSEPA